MCKKQKHKKRILPTQLHDACATNHDRRHLAVGDAEQDEEPVDAVVAVSVMKHRSGRFGPYLSNTECIR